MATEHDFGATDSSALTHQDHLGLQDNKLIDLSRNTFSKEFHLLTPAEFKFVFIKAKKFSNRHWTLIVRPNQKTTQTRLDDAKKNLSVLYGEIE